MLTINELKKMSYEIARDKGFWDGVLRTVDDRNTYVYVTKIALAITELSEAIEALRKGDEENLVEELADTYIRIADFCQFTGLDLEKAIIEKTEKNRKRPYKHNKKF